MTLFIIKNKVARQLKKEKFRNEKELQAFIEKNLETLLGIRFLATEYTISQSMNGRIDTLGLDENNSPVIIEYKWGEKSNIINQGLFYLDWLVDHKGDFQILVQEKLGKSVKVDYGSPRVILIAQTYNRYDKHAVNRMAENIELMTYSKYENDLMELQLFASSQAKISAKNKKQISKVNYQEYSVEAHLKNKPKKLKVLFKELRDKIMLLESNQKIEENPRKHYIAYRTNKNFVELLLQSKAIKVFLDLPKNQLNDPKNIVRDMANIGHYGTGNLEVKVKDFEDIEYVVSLIEQSYLQ